MGENLSVNYQSNRGKPKNGGIIKNIHNTFIHRNNKLFSKKCFFSLYTIIYIYINMVLYFSICKFFVY